MDYKIFSFKLDLGRESRNAIKPVQGESAVKLRPTLTHNSQPYNLTDADVRCIFRKPDGTYSYIDAVIIDAAKGIVEIELTNQVLLLSGSVVSLIEVTGAIGIARTWMFTLDVQPGLLSTDIESVDEFPAVEQMIIDVAEIKANFNAIVAGVTVDGEVILARSGFTTLGDRINDLAAKVNTTIPAQLAETEQRINNIIVTPAEGVSEQEILDARQGEGSLGTNIAKVKEQVLEVKKPQPTVKNIGSKKPLVSFVDDDGVMAVLTKLKPLVIAKQIPYTLAIIADKLDSASDTADYMGRDSIKDLYDNFGFEIASHSLTHQAIGTLDEAGQWSEILGSYEKIQSKGINVEYLVYPYGSNDRLAREKVVKVFKGALGTDARMNTSPFYTYNMGRIPLGYSAPVGQDTLAYYKSKVDEAIANNTWVIFMTHVGNPGHTATQQQHLSDLIDYIKTTSAKIVSLKEGFERVGNILEIGDYTDSGYQFIGTDNNNNTVNYKPILVNPTTGIERVNFAMKPSEYEKSKTVVSMIYASRAPFPNGEAGVFTTVMTEDRAYAYQTYSTVSGKFWVRYPVVGSDAWGAFSELLSTTGRVIANVLTGTVPANGFITKLINIPFYTFFKTVVLVPRFEMPTGLLYSYCLTGATGTIKITIHNASGADVVLPTGDWMYTLIS